MTHRGGRIGIGWYEDIVKDDPSENAIFELASTLLKDKLTGIFNIFRENFMKEKSSPRGSKKEQLKHELKEKKIIKKEKKLIGKMEKMHKNIKRK